MMGCYEDFMTHNNIALTDQTWEKHCHVVSGEKLLYLVMERALKRAMTLPESDAGTGSCEYNTSDCGPRCPTSIQCSCPLTIQCTIDGGALLSTLLSIKYQIYCSQII